MCGILGSVNVSFGKDVLDLLSHRGPDDSGIDEMRVNGHDLTFGQTRLSIQDLSPAGHQPMFSDCGNYMIILNGEIYNHLELRQKLSGNIKFRGHSDTETILYYIKEFGIEGVKDFNGIFSLAFCDRTKNLLYLVRDPFGVKPLYFTEGDNKKIVFASEIRPLKHLVSNLMMDEEALATLLRLRYNPAPDTLYKSIKKLQPGHFLTVDLNNKELKFQSQAFLEEIPPVRKLSKVNLTEEYGIMLEAAVKRQLLSDVEVGIFLSGGIDSALIALLAQRHYTGKLKAFSVGFEGTNIEDEIEDASETASILGLEHRIKKISFIDFLGILRECTRIVEEPLATTSIIPMYYLSELASKEVKVVLTGQGADEPLGGYTRYKSELVRNRVPRFLRRMDLPNTFVKSLKSENLSKALDALSIEDEIERFLKIWEVFSTAEIEKLISVKDKLSYQKVAYFHKLLNCNIKKDPVERLMALDARLNLADDLLNYTDKVTMNFALECRVPMLDIELVKFIEALPSHLKLDITGGKKIHKQFAKNVLPDRIIARKKKGFLSPTNSWFRNESEIISDLLLTSGTPFSKIINQSFVAEIIKLHQKGVNQEKKIFLLLSILFWLESWSNENKAESVLKTTGISVL